MSAYVDDATVIVSNSKLIELIGTALKDYEAVSGEKTNKRFSE